MIINIEIRKWIIRLIVAPLIYLESVMPGFDEKSL